MIDWARVFVPDTPLPEIVVRGTVMYLALYIMLRFILKRESGTTGVTDLLMIVLLADAAQNAMAGGYTAIGDGVVLVAVIIGWSYLLDAAAYRWPAAARVIRPPALLLVRDGRILRRNMRREFITDEELYGQLREQGIPDLSDVREVRMESDGQISVVTRETETSHRRRRGRNGP